MSFLITTCVSPISLPEHEGGNAVTRVTFGRNGLVNTCARLAGLHGQNCCVDLRPRVGAFTNGTAVRYERQSTKTTARMVMSFGSVTGAAPNLTSGLPPTPPRQSGQPPS